MNLYPGKSPKRICPYDGYPLKAIFDYDPKDVQGLTREDLQTAEVRVKMYLICPFCGHERMRPTGATMTRFVVLFPEVDPEELMFGGPVQNQDIHFGRIY